MKKLLKTIIFANLVLEMLFLSPTQALAQWCDKSAPNTTQCTNKAEGAACQTRSGASGTCRIRNPGPPDTECDCNAPPTPTPEEGRLTNPLAPLLSPADPEAGVSIVESIIRAIVRLLLVVSAILFFFLFIIGGIRWIISGGDKAQLESARTTIINALVGLVIVFSVFAVIKLIELIFGVDIIEFEIGPLRVG